MRNKLQYRDSSYFDQRSDDVFVFFTVGFVMKLSKIERIKGSWYFSYPGLQIKATTTECISIKELERTIVYDKTHTNNPNLVGIIGGVGILNTEFIYVYWGRIFDLKQPSGYALYNMYHLTEKI